MELSCLQLLCVSDVVVLLWKHDSACYLTHFLLFPSSLIWIKIYSAAFPPRKSSWKADPVEETAACTSLLAIGEKEAGYWKKEYIAKQIASVKRALARVLRPVNPYTGLPVKTKEALRCVVCSAFSSGWRVTAQHG